MPERMRLDDGHVRGEGGNWRKPELQMPRLRDHWRRIPRQRQAMNIQLTPSWQLTTEHAASSYGIPVLVNRHESFIAYGPEDIVQPYPSWSIWPAWKAVARMASVKLDLTPEEQAAILEWCKIGIDASDECTTG